MIKSELFQLNKLQILNSKKQYLLEYAKQIENSIASTWESNQTLKTQLEKLNNQVTKRKQQTEGPLEEELAIYKQAEREKLKKLQELKKLIQEYKFLCSEAAKYTTYQAVFTQPNESQIQNRNQNNTTPSRSHSQKKITTKLYCQTCQRHFFPNEYFRHCKEYHGGEENYQSLRG